MIHASHSCEPSKPSCVQPTHDKKQHLAGLPNEGLVRKGTLAIHSVCAVPVSAREVASHALPRRVAEQAVRSQL